MWTNVGLRQKQVFTVSLLLGACSCHGNSPLLPAGDLVAFEHRLEELQRSAPIPGMAGVVARGDQILWQQGFGFADLANETPATPMTAFHLASLTKPFAAVVLMWLVEQQKLSLDEPVSTFGIELQSAGTIRVRHLLTHTSEGVPGERFRYNGDRFALLDQVIVGASGQTFARLVFERIISPLGLIHTAPNVLSPADFAVTGYDEAGFQQNLARGYQSDGRTRQPYPFSFSSAAGLLSSALDVVRFSRALDEDELLTGPTREQMFTPVVSSSGERLAYGLGWFVHDTERAELIWHYGYWTGNSSLIVKVPEQDLTFVLLANSDMLSRPYALGGDSNVLRSPYARAFFDVFVEE